MSKEGKHHFIPIFYLKQWTGNDKKICEYKQRYHGVLPKRVYPNHTGYVHGLYSVPGMPPEDAQYVEKRFMQAVDDKASIALRAILDENLADISEPLKIAWASFLYSLTFRSPNVLKRMQTTMDEEIKRRTTPHPSIPLAAAEIFPSLLSSALVVRGLLSMEWMATSVKGAKNWLLTSDRPVIMTNGLSRPADHIALPISPTAFFLAYRSQDTLRQIKSVGLNELVTKINNSVSKQAIDFVYSVDDSQTRFIGKRLGQRVRATPLD